MTPSPGLLVLGALAGACLGSFAVTLGLRAARGEQALSGRSRCDGCGETLSLARTAPLVSYLAAKGFCVRCGGAIDPLHPVGEVAGLALGVACLFIVSPPRAALTAGLGLTLLAAAAMDARSLRLPDLATGLVAFMGLALAALSSWAAVVIGVVSALVTFVALEALRRGYRAVRGRPGLGFGDVKLLAALAIWLGPLTPWAMAGAAGLGLVWVVARRPAPGDRFAFGPFLALVGWLTGLAAELGLTPGVGRLFA